MNLKILLLTYSFVSLFSVYAKDIAQKQLLTVHIVTWNVNGKKPQEITELLGQDQQNLPDIVIIGLQEVSMKPGKTVANSVLSDEWSIKIEDFLTKKNSYFKADAHAQVGTIQHIYVKQKHAISISDIKATSIKTSEKGAYGGVIAKFQLHKRWYCIVNGRFHSNDEGLQARIKDYETINEERVKFCNNPSDYAFWLGDLNFRLDEKLDDKKIRELVQQKKFDDLLKQDELRVNKDSKKVFVDFKEEPIKFPPTFQLITGSGEYSKEQRPAWTDRILFKSDSDKTIKPALYISMDSYKISDHCPVKAQFQIAGK